MNNISNVPSKSNVSVDDLFGPDFELLIPEITPIGVEETVGPNKRRASNSVSVDGEFSQPTKKQRTVEQVLTAEIVSEEDVLKFCVSKIQEKNFDCVSKLVLGNTVLSNECVIRISNQLCEALILEDDFVHASEILQYADKLEDVSNDQKALLMIKKAILHCNDKTMWSFERAMELLRSALLLEPNAAIRKKLVKNLSTVSEKIKSNTLSINVVSETLTTKQNVLSVQNIVNSPQNVVKDSATRRNRAEAAKIIAECKANLGDFNKIRELANKGLNLTNIFFTQRNELSEYLFNIEFRDGKFKEAMTVVNILLTQYRSSLDLVKDEVAVLWNIRKIGILVKLTNFRDAIEVANELICEYGEIGGDLIARVYLYRSKACVGLYNLNQAKESLNAGLNLNNISDKIKKLLSDDLEKIEAILHQKNAHISLTHLETYQ